MKKIFFIIFFLFLFNNLLSQTSIFQDSKIVYKYENRKFHKMPTLSLDAQFQILKGIILQQYGRAFRYYDQIKNGSCAIELEQSLANSKRERAIADNDYNIIIKDLSHDKVIDRIKLTHQYNDDGKLEIQLDRKDFERFLDFKILRDCSSAGSVNYTTTICGLVVKDSIFEDQEIIKCLELPEGDGTKIFDKKYQNSYLPDKNGNQVDLFNLCMSGILIPMGTNGQNSKVLTLDNGFHSIIYFNANGEFNDPGPFNKCYGYGGTDEGQFYNPTGIAVGRDYNTTNNVLIYHILISDYANDRIITVNYEIDKMHKNRLGSFDNNSYRIFNSIHNPYDIAYFKDNTTTGTNDKIWISQENVGHSHIICLDNAGKEIQNFTGYRDHFIGLTYYFNEAEDIRLSIHDYNFRTIVFTDKSRNRFVSCLLDSVGEGTAINSDQGHVIEAMDIVDFCTNDTINSVHIQKLGTSEEWPYIWVTSRSYIHSFVLDEFGRVQYLASANKPKESDDYFTNLLNTICANGSYDLITIENWNSSYGGFRRYLPFCDLYHDSLQSYCIDSIDHMRFMANFTNYCWLYITAYRQNNSVPNGWEQVKIKKMNGAIIDSTVCVKYQLAGQNQTYWGRYVDLQLDLPFKDYIYGTNLRMNLKMYPQYQYPDPACTDYKEKNYYVVITKNCNPKPH